MGNLNGNFNQVGEFLDFAGDAHVDVLVTDRHNHASNDGWVNFSRKMDGLVGFHEFLNAKINSLV